MLLIPFNADHHSPAARARCAPSLPGSLWRRRTEAYVASLRELLGLIGAYEWRKKGVEVPALKGRIHAHYGVFSPLRGEYIDLEPLAAPGRPGSDIGTGSGALAAVLAQRAESPASSAPTSRIGPIRAPPTRRA